MVKKLIKMVINVEKNVSENIKKNFALIFFYTLDIRNIISTQSFTNIVLPSLFISKARRKVF